MKSKRILIVDDEPTNIFLLRSMLKANNYETLTAANGIQALQIAEAEMPDAILLDIMMPEMDGIETLEAIMENDRLKNIPVIMVTAKVGAEDVQLALEKGAIEYIKKPFEDTELLARLKTVLRIKEQEAALKDFIDKTDLVNQLISSHNDIIEPEKKIFELILMNLKPKTYQPVEKEVRKTRYFSKVAVLYADFANFNISDYSSNPSIMINDLYGRFQELEEIGKKFSMEKIKTVGDVILFAGGLNNDEQLASLNAILAGSAFVEKMNEINSVKAKHNQKNYPLRIGIHIGEVALGMKNNKYYDIWGDTLNIAYRIKMKAEPGVVTVSKDIFKETELYCTFNKINVIESMEKKTDLLELYQFSRLNEKYAQDKEGKKPNNSLLKLIR
jgi:CheY-like chemotaxis protein/class 3 adenylate cyclase